MGKEARKQKSLVVSEVRELAPLADVFELSPHAKYLVFLEASSLVGGQERAKEKATAVIAAFKKLNIPCVVLIGLAKDLTIMELKGEKV